MKSAVILVGMTEGQTGAGAFSLPFLMHSMLPESETTIDLTAGTLARPRFETGDPPYSGVKNTND